MGNDTHTATAADTFEPLWQWPTPTKMAVTEEVCSNLSGYAPGNVTGLLVEVCHCQEGFVSNRQGCRVVADKGHTGKSDAEKDIFAVANTLDTDDVKEFKKRAKARQEVINKKEMDDVHDRWMRIGLSCNMTGEDETV